MSLDSKAAELARRRGEQPQAPDDERFCSCGAERGHYGWQACAAGLPRTEPCLVHYPGYDESCAACLAVAELVHQRLVVVEEHG